MTVIKVRLRVIFLIERVVPVLPRHSERGGTPRVESPTAEKKSTEFKDPIATKGSGEADWGIVRKKTNATDNPTIPPSFSSENDTSLYTRAAP